jgi:GNAT superfamily N-acetyltransferase
MSDYRVRVATVADIDALVRHRLGMFSDMGVATDEAALTSAFRGWVEKALTSGLYRAWVAEEQQEEGQRGAPAIAGGGGITILPWPPGPRYLTDRLAFVYNLYTEPPHRRRGIAHLIMDAIHDWCRTNGIRSIALNASSEGRPLYERIGYRVSPNPMMFLAL